MPFNPPPAGAGDAEGVADGVGDADGVRDGAAGDAAGAGCVLDGLLDALEAAAREVSDFLEAQPLEAFSDPATASRTARACRIGRRVEAVTGRLAHLGSRRGAFNGCAQGDAAGVVAAAGGLGRREANRLVLAAGKASRWPGVCRVWAAGGASSGQVEAADRWLRRLEGCVGADDLASAEEALVSRFGQLDAAGLGVLGRRLFEVMAPGRAQEEDEAAAGRALERARAESYLRFWDDLDGRVGFQGMLPPVEGRAFRRVVEARAEAIRRERRGGPLARRVARPRAMAEGLAGLVEADLRASRSPKSGGDRPRVVVALTLAELRAGAMAAGRASEADGLPAGELRRLLCDCGVLPVVFGGASEVLDVGREERTAPAGLRRGLEARDGGCAFPGCDAPVERCEAHHVVPWSRGGETCLGNMVLLCPYHHRMVEPGPHGPPAWSVVFQRGTGLPGFARRGLVEPAPGGGGFRPATPRVHERHLVDGWVSGVVNPDGAD